MPPIAGVGAAGILGQRLAKEILGVGYYPGESGMGFHLTVNMSKLGGGAGESRARWYDPTNGAYQIIGRMENSGAHVFTTPNANSQGAADWVLVLDAASQ
jgi:hypothetical protein